jgi:polar amino acid transport system substrate-binding protein
MKKLTLLLILVLAAALLSACANMTGSASPVIDGILQKKTLVLGTSGSQPPFSMTTRDGALIGFDIDIAQAMADAMGVSLKIETMPFAELLPALKAGRVDMVISGLTITPRRNLDMAFVGPYFISGKSVLTKLETIAEIDDASEINMPGMTLTALEGSTSQEFIEAIMPDATFLPAADYDEAVDMVLNDKVKALVADYPVCIISIFRYPGNGLISMIRPLSFEPLGIALPGNDPLLVNWVENFLSACQGTGRLDELKEVWFGDASWVELLP